MESVFCLFVCLFKSAIYPDWQLTKCSLDSSTKDVHSQSATIFNMVTVRETETLLSKPETECTVRNSICPSSARKPFKFHKVLKAFFFFFFLKSFYRFLGSF